MIPVSKEHAGGMPLVRKSNKCRQFRHLQINFVHIQFSLPKCIVKIVHQQRRTCSWLTGMEHKNISCLFAAVESSPKDKICTISFILFKESNFLLFLWYYLFTSSPFFRKGMVTRSLNVTGQHATFAILSRTLVLQLTKLYYYYRGYTRCECCPGVAMSHLIHRTCSIYDNSNTCI